MSQFTAFTKKEILQAKRSGKILILVILFCLFGIMNPAIAKLTPWLLEWLSEDLAENGIAMGTVRVDALTSWTQFFKNMPIVLIVFLILFSSHLTEEYQKGTLINMLTKGLRRHNIILSKFGIACLFWTIGCLMSFFITYFYNAYFWDNAIAHNLFFSVFSFYLVGLWLISVIYPASVLFSASSAVLFAVGCAFGLSYLIGFLPKLKAYVPTNLLNSQEMLLGKTAIEDYLWALVITVVFILCNIIVSVMIFDKRQV